MSETTTGRPRPRAFWSDTRFLLGIALIAVSIAGVWFVVAAARHTVPVFAAARTIVPGEVVAAGDLQVIEVALGHVEDSYATPATFEPGSIAVRTIAAGELVPRSAVGGADGARTTTVVLSSTAAVPAAVGVGSAVEVWTAPQLERGVFDTPRVLVPAATVVSVSTDRSMIGGAATEVELVIDRADVAATLTALSDGSNLSIVPLPGAKK